MIREYKFDLLTMLFSAGADPKHRAEIRAPEIRGALRWWFRVLGGFKGDSRAVSDQEVDIFGGIVGDKPVKSRLAVRVTEVNVTQSCGDANRLGAGQNTPLGYLLFPLRSNDKKGVDASRCYFQPNDPKRGAAFTLSLVWRGDEESYRGIEALMSIFGRLGSLGFRSRRCMGALAFHGTAPMPVQEALAYFSHAEDAILVKRLAKVWGEGSGYGMFSPTSADDCVKGLAKWLKAWRSYGPSSQRNPFLDGFRFASIDHDIGLGQGRGREAVRPAIGLPIVQQYSMSKKRNEWVPHTSDNERFASPVLLRPYRGEDGRWDALVVFVEARRWNPGDKVDVGDHSENVSLGLYEAMLGDEQLDSWAKF